MAVKIGHASIDERGKINGGTAGDSTGKEVCVRSWYSGGWNVVLRPKNPTLAEKSAVACEKGCANGNIGYDQYQRNTLYSYAKAVNFDLAKISTKCECDCSSFMHTCAIAGGANLTYGSNGYVTSTMVNAFVKSGDYEKLTTSKYLTSDKYLKRGDILVRTSGHTAMVLSNGTGVGSVTTTKTTTTTTSINVEAAQSFSKSYAKAYTVTAKSCLNMRCGAGTNKSIITTLKNGATFRCYGYYTKQSDGTIWLYGVSEGQTGFCSKAYLA